MKHQTTTGGSVAVGRRADDCIHAAPSIVAGGGLCIGRKVMPLQANRHRQTEKRQRPGQQVSWHYVKVEMACVGVKEF